MHLLYAISFRLFIDDAVVCGCYTMLKPFDVLYSFDIFFGHGEILDKFLTLKCVFSLLPLMG